MAKPAGTIALLLAIAVLAILSSSASAQSACAAGTALMNQANAQELTEDCDTLLSARDTLAGTGILNWSGSLGIEEWDGVSVDGSSGRVTGLNLRAAGLDGQIPVELGNLDQLESLHLGENRLNGEIPSEIGRLDALQMLYLNANRLTGNIPAELGTFGRLQRMYLNGNQLDGGIPPALGGLASLRVLSVSQNLMVGEIPVELGLLGNLEELYLNANQLSGEIPAELGDLSSLERLYLNGNQFTGMIPTALGSLTNLRVLSLSQNQLTGEIPSELGSLTSLQSLYLDGNQLDGMTPTALGGLANLQHLRLSGNQLTGCVPHTLLGAIIDAQPLGLPTCEAPATPGSLTVVIDVDGPRAPVRLNTPIGLTATFSQPVADFTADDISVAYGTVANFEGTGLSYTFDVTPSAAGPVTVDIPAGSATDASGNGNAAADQLLIGISYDDNDDAGISKREAITAIIDYFDRHITKAQAIGVIGLYFTSPVVIPRVANAGPDTEALESSTVMLDGTATTGPEGSISFYRWEQVINGSRLVSLTGTDIASPTFTLPRLSNNQDFAFRLTVTYNNGETSQDEVAITGRPIPGVIVGAVSGHTAVLNAVAEFVIRLRSRPSADVVIPIFSSNESEGVPEQTEVVFTPENWPEEQIVSVRGQNANVRGGVQNYEIILGDTQSADPFYDGLEIANVAMKGISLEIMSPERLDSLIANIPAVIQPSVTYTGSHLLSYALVDAPEGMSIDFNNGTIFWTPAESNEGQAINVNVRVNDGALFVETTFSVAVVAPEAIETEIIESEVDGNKLTVTDEDTDLNGLEITSPPDESAITPGKLEELQEALGKVAPEDVPTIPSWITPISDVFVVKGTFDNPVELRFPIRELPDGVFLSDFNLYAHAETMHSDGMLWSPVVLDYSIAGTQDQPIYVLKLTGLTGMAFWGYHLTERAITERAINSDPIRSATKFDGPAASESIPENAVDPSTLLEFITCTPHEQWGSRTYQKQTCVYSEDSAVKIEIHNFGDNENATRWGGMDSAGNSNPVPIEVLASWIVAAQPSFEDLGLGYDKAITVKIEGMTGRLTGAIGYVRLYFEFRNTIHLTDDNTWTSDQVKSGVFHEYFHHAQGDGDTKVSGISGIGQTLLMGLASKYDDYAWLAESTAEWFADELAEPVNNYALNSYRPILEVGLHASNGERERNPYLRFGIMMLMDNSCEYFSTRDFRELFNVNIPRPLNAAGIKSFAEYLEDASCDFGQHLGPEQASTLQAAMVFYVYATLLKNQISLLDPSEDDSTYNFSEITGIDRRNYYTIDANRSRQAVYDGRIPAVGAYNVTIKPGGSTQRLAGKDIQLAIEADREILVSITSESDEFQGFNTIGPDQDSHLWFSTGDRVSQSTYTRTGDGGYPELFVTLVNSSLTDFANVRVFVEAVDAEEEPVYPSITSHSDGEQVSNRVITITGTIPEEARDEVDRVIISASGLEDGYRSCSSDGSFSEQVHRIP